MLPDRPVSLKYAHEERERRYLVPDPSLVPTSAARLHIRDRYLTGTRLRLRATQERLGVTTWKLGQKIRCDEQDASSIAHTTLYLNEEEYQLLAALPASTLSKSRSVVPLGPAHAAAFDVFEGPLTGLILVEIDSGAGGSNPPIPAWLGREVTSIEAFTGFGLSQLDASQLEDLLETHSPRR